MRNVSGWFMVAVVCMVGIASAQVVPRPGTRPAAAPAAPAAASQGTSDQQIAALLHGGNKNEAELAKFAEQRAKSESVKDFAAMMIKDHSQAADTYARWAGNLAGGAARTEAREERREVRREPAEEPRRDEAKRDEAKRDERRDEAKRDEPPRPGAKAEPRREERREAREERRDEGEGARPAARGGQQPLNWVTIHKQFGEQCLKSAKEELGRYEGDDFDKAYMGQQIVAHMKTKDELTVLKNYASSQLQQEIESSLETVEGHLKEARKIMDEQKEQGSKGTSGRKPKAGEREQE